MSRKKRRKPNVRPPASKPRKLAAKPVEEMTDAEKDKLIIELTAETQKQIDQLAYQMYLNEGGEEFEDMLENGQYVRAAFQSQIRAAKEGGSGWGPNITPYEDRMRTSMQMRLIREKREWIAACRERVIEALKDRHANEADETEQPADGTETESRPNAQEMGFTSNEPATRELETMTAASSP